MIVPFIFDKTEIIEVRNLHEFLTGVRMQLDERNGIMIAQSEYNHDLEYFRKTLGRTECDAPYGEPPKILTQEDIDSVDIYYIDDNIFNRIGFIKDDIERENLRIAHFLLENRFIEFEDELERIYSEVCLKYPNEKIEALLTFRQYKSVEVWANRHGINIIYYDLSTFRWPVYHMFAYLDLKGFLIKTEISKRYKKFLNFKGEVPIFSNLEILALTLEKDYEKFLTNYFKEPKYKCGIALQEGPIDGLLPSRTMHNSDMIDFYKEIYANSEICIREDRRAGFEAHCLKGEIDLDENVFSFQFINECESIISLCSNMAFETRLWGKKSVVAENAIYEFCSDKIVDGVEVPKFVDNDVCLSFCTFGFYIPYERLRNTEYLRWRLSNPSEKDIYMDNLLYYLKLRGIPYEAVEGKDKLKKILCAQGFEELYNSIYEKSDNSIKNRIKQLIKKQLG